MVYKFEVLTVRDVSFKDEKSDRQIEGMQLWLTGQTEDKSWNGWEVFKIWVDGKSNMAADVHLLRRGDHVQVDYDRRGKARMITLV